MWFCKRFLTVSWPFYERFVSVHANGRATGERSEMSRNVRSRNAVTLWNESRYSFTFTLQKRKKHSSLFINHILRKLLDLGHGLILQIRIKFYCKNYDFLPLPFWSEWPCLIETLSVYYSHLTVFNSDRLWRVVWGNGCGVASLKTVTGQNQTIAVINVWTLDEFSSVCLYFGLLFLKVGVSEIYIFHYKLCFYIITCKWIRKTGKKAFSFFS